jgi:ubiquitin C-terminal hydrolase
MNFNYIPPIQAPGLENCGNSCFMNSGLQLLFAIDEIRNAVLSFETPQIITHEVNIILIVQRFFILMSIKDQSVIKFGELAKHYKDLYNLLFPSNAQFPNNFNLPINLSNRFNSKGVYKKDFLIGLIQFIRDFSINNLLDYSEENIKNSFKKIQNIIL